MAIDFKLDFYDVSSCGFYTSGASTPKFGDFKILMEDFRNFLSGKNLSLTKTYDYDENSGDLPTYCYDFIGENDLILITWNQTPFEEGKVSSVNGNDVVGSVNVELTDVPDGNIPGYATYFWLIPEENLIVSLRPAGVAFNGHQNLRKYLSNFIRYYSRYNILDPNDNNIVLGYGIDEIDSEKLYPRFETFLKKKPTDREFLISSASEIYKIIKKDNLSLTSDVEISLLDTILNALLLEDVDKNILIENLYRLELDYTPSSEEMERIIDGYDQSPNHQGTDFGFMIHGRNTAIWLSRTYEKHDFSFNIERNPGEVIQSEVLFQEIIRNREVLLSLLE